MSPDDLKFSLNPSLGIPIYRQIMDGVKGLIAAGRLSPGDRLPSIRELSGKLRINPSSAVKAYSELEHEGVISLDHGRGTFVSSKPGLAAQSREELLRRDLDALLQRAEALGFDIQDIQKELKNRRKL